VSSARPAPLPGAALLLLLLPGRVLLLLLAGAPP
jgi:hypothetical protein